jgi:class 3 adenylate cyclase
LQEAHIWSIGSPLLALLGVVLLAGTGLLLWLGQVAGAVLLPLIGLLLLRLSRRDQRARTIARRIADGRLDQKLEVRHGAWGELDRAVNGLLQEQRIERRLRAAQPAPLPDSAVRALLGGELPSEGEPRMVAVLVASCTARAPLQHERGQRAALQAWQALAHTAHDLARQHGALLQPCGDAIMLVFGAFMEQPVGQSLRAAQAAAEQLRGGWRTSSPLALSLAIGSSLAAALPGLGFCVVGAPIGEAIELQQVARASRHYGLVCGESVYHALRQAPGAAWQPTELRLPAQNRASQVIYTQLEGERML